MSQAAAGKVWVAEYLGAAPCPIYMTAKVAYTTEIYRAAMFPSEAEARTWMSENGLAHTGTGVGWNAVEHVVSIGV